MQNLTAFLGSFLTILLVLTACGSEQTETEAPETPGRQLDFTEEVSFLNTNGEEIATIEAALADEQNERNQGLMEVTEPSTGCRDAFYL